MPYWYLHTLDLFDCFIKGESDEKIKRPNVLYLSVYIVRSITIKPLQFRVRSVTSKPLQNLLESGPLQLKCYKNFRARSVTNKQLHEN